MHVGTKKHGKSHYGYKNHVKRGPHPQIGAAAITSPTPAVQ